MAFQATKSQSTISNSWTPHIHVLVLHYKSAISDCVNFDVHSKTGGFVFQFCPDYVFKQVSDPVELHDVFGLALQPELVKLYEEIAEKRTIRGKKLKTHISRDTMVKV